MKNSWANAVSMIGVCPTCGKSRLLTSDFSPIITAQCFSLTCIRCRTEYVVVQNIIQCSTCYCRVDCLSMGVGRVIFKKTLVKKLLDYQSKRNYYDERTL